MPLTLVVACLEVLSVMIAMLAIQHVLPLHHGWLALKQDLTRENVALALPTKKFQIANQNILFVSQMMSVRLF